MEVERDLKKEFAVIIQKMNKNADLSNNIIITPDNVFQPARKKNRDIFKAFIETVILEESSIEGLDSILKFYEGFKNGKSSLILSEHKSNFDVPGLFVLMHQYEKIYQEIFEKIVFVAGRKLNEENPSVKVMAEQFHRVIVVPKGEVSEEDSAEQEKSIRVNITAQKFIRDNKNHYIFLIFPTGTRSKPWDKKTYKGLRQAFNYIKNFDQIIFMSINGTCMVPQPTAMIDEVPRRDSIKIIFSEVRNSKEFIQECKRLWEQTSKKVDFKQFTINRAMDIIYNQKGIMLWEEK